MSEHSDALALLSARREAEIVLRHNYTAFSPEMAAKLIDTVNMIDKNLAVVCSQVETLEKTLLGNGHDGTCKQHSDSITMLRDDMKENQGRIKAVSSMSKTAMGLAALMLTAVFGVWNIMHKQSDESDAFKVAVQSEQMKSAAKQTVIQESLDEADKQAKQAKVQRNAIQAAQRDDNQPVIYKIVRPQKHTIVRP